VSELHAQLIDWAVAHTALPGETESGDLHLVGPFEGGVLVAAIDGLGHGSEAAAAARCAAAAIEGHYAEPVTSLLERCHQGLRGTRGAVITLASFDARRGTMSWVGVGNIEATLVRVEPHEGRARESVMLIGGVPGHQLPSLRSADMPVAPGDMLVLSTDGIRPGYFDLLGTEAPPQELAGRILDEYGKGTDDALVLVARYLGNPS
jgi:phosphoserine phosphatase RsbX